MIKVFGVGNLRIRILREWWWEMPINNSKEPKIESKSKEIVKLI